MCERSHTLHIKSSHSLLLLTAVVLTVAFNDAQAGFPAPPAILIQPGLPGSSVNVRVSGYVPAPPGVKVQIDSGRPYYVESNRRVYMERGQPRGHYKKKHYKKAKKHHEDEGNHYGHDKHKGRGGHGH